MHSMQFANKKDANQPAYSHNLIGIFDICSLDMLYPKFREASFRSWAGKFVCVISKERFSHDLGHGAQLFLHTG